MENALTTQLEEHEVIRASIRMFDERLNKGGADTAEGNGKNSGLDIPLERMRNVRWNVFYFIDGLKAHFERDEAIVFPHANASELGSAVDEHEQLRKQAEAAVILADRLLLPTISPADYNSGCAQLRRIISNIRNVVEMHTRAEDIILRKAIESAQAAKPH